MTFARERRTNFRLTQSESEMKYNLYFEVFDPGSDERWRRVPKYWCKSSENNPSWNETSVMEETEAGTDGE